MDIGKISIIVPIFNVERYLDKCLKSILHQTYQNLEVILVDDGSPDACPRLCDEWAQKDNRIKVIHKKNGGLSTARNAGLQVLTGDFLTFVDPDDYLENDTVYEKLMKCFSNKIQAVFFGAYMVNEKEKVLGCIEAGNDCVITSEKAIKGIIQDNLLYGGGFTWNKIWKINLNSFLCFEEDLFAYEDKRWVLAQLLHVENVFLSNETGYCYLQRDTSLVHDASKETDRWWNGVLAYKRIYNDFILDDRFSDTVKRKYNELVLLFAWRAVKNKNYEFLALLADDYQKEVKKKRIKGLKERIKHLIIMFYIKKACKDKK